MLFIFSVFVYKAVYGVFFEGGLYFLGMRADTMQAFLPSGEKLYSFPERVVKEVRGIALAVIRCLFCPILKRHLAGMHRRRVLQLRRGSGELEAKMLHALEQLSAPAQLAHAVDMGAELARVSWVMKQVAASADYRVFTQREFVQYLGEPGNAVVVLLVGSVTRRVRMARVRGKSVLEKTIFRPFTAPGSVVQGDETSQVSRASSALSLRRSSVSSVYSEKPSQCTVVCAPAVFGEYNTVGGYPWTEYIVAESPLVVTASLSKNAYCGILGAFPKHIQKKVLLMALQSREKLIPLFAPMTIGRMRLCPLLTDLSDENLLHLMDYLVPHVKAAGMQIGELNAPQHIFFIRRGTVYIRHEELFLADLSSATQPKCRSLLVEGHTFGERQCIFREALGDTFYAVTNVDLYALPFSVLIQFMKQQPDARKIIYASAKAASLVLENDYERMRFVPSSVEEMGTVFLGSALMSKLFHRRVSISTISSRRITPLAALAANTGKMDGKVDQSACGVSPHFVEQIRKIPLLDLCSPDDAFYAECASHWNMFLYDAGEYIVRRGGECNRLLLFPQGGAAVVLNEKNASQCLVDSSTPFFRQNFSLVPRECIIGYTCVRRHPWALSVIALENQLEVWEIKRVKFLELLRKYQLERKMQEIVLQLLQPLMCLPGRSTVLDMQPLLAPAPNSLWSEHRIPNLHPVSLCEHLRFPVWKEGDLPLGSYNLKIRRSTI
ncbi:putative cyclic nucleotide-binding domain containing protein [Trypanosoma cruzi]|nr:putative cyclic nucleotide-binding domain containing protein [Trypanosoma cruzi]